MLALWTGTSRETRLVVNNHLTPKNPSDSIPSPLAVWSPVRFSDASSSQIGTGEDSRGRTEAVAALRPNTKCYLTR